MTKHIKILLLFIFILTNKLVQYSMMLEKSLNFMTLAFTNPFSKLDSQLVEYFAEVTSFGKNARWK